MNSMRLVGSFFWLLLNTVASAAPLPNYDASIDPNLQSSTAPLGQPTLPSGAAINRDDRGVPAFVSFPAAAPGKAGARLAAMRTVDAALKHVRDYAVLYGLTDADIAALRVSGVHDTGEGAKITTFTQDINGIEVYGDALNVVTSQDNALVALSGRLGSTANIAGTFQLTPQQTLSLGFKDLAGAAIAPTDLVDIGATEGNYRIYMLAPHLDLVLPVKQIGPNSIRQKDVYFHLGDVYIPARYMEYDLGNKLTGEERAYAEIFSADDGRLLLRYNQIQDAAFTYRVWAETDGQFTPYDGPHGHFVHPTGVPDGTQLSFIQPNLVTLPNVPFSRNDPWLPDGATESRGNNVDAFADLIPPDGFTPVNPDGGLPDLRADITAPGTFDRTFDTSQDPQINPDQIKAAVTQLFFVNNWQHDIYYDRGFDEISRNAQANNFGRGGLQNDDIVAEGQDFSGRNNANMLTPADGAHPRMRMYIFDGLGPKDVIVNSPAPERHFEPGVNSTWGPQTYTITGNVELVREQGGTHLGCLSTPYDPDLDLNGKIAMVDRGSCNFTEKVKKAQDAGAIGALIANNDSGVISMGGTDPTITIGALMVSQADGNTIRGLLPQGVNIILQRATGTDRDGTIDNEVISHEWMHYLSGRLIGDGSGLGTQQSGGMNEGWSDFNSLTARVRAGDALVPSNRNFSGIYGVGVYVTSSAVDRYNRGPYFAIRRVPYSTDMTKDPLTFKHIQDGVPLPTGVPIAFGQNGANNSEVHNTGEIWTTMLWECYASLLRDTLGDHPRLTFRQAQDRMRGYIVAADKATPRNPTFTQARDAILAAAQANSLTDYQEFGRAFAKRGLGVEAVAPPSASTNNAPAIESFGWALVAQSGQVTDVTGVYCDRDGILDNNETGRATFTIRNTGRAGHLAATSGRINSTQLLTPDGGTDPGTVTVANEGRMAFGETDPEATASGTVDISLAGATGIRELRINVSFADPSGGSDLSRTFAVRVNTDEVRDSSKVDDAEATTPVWTFAHDNALGDSDWSRHEISALNHNFIGPEPAMIVDEYMVSPPLHVGTGDFKFTFKQRFSFKPRQLLGFCDGGRIGISTDDGATWTDVLDAGGTLMPPYNQVSPTSCAGPFRGVPIYAGDSPGYPAYQDASVDLGTAFAGQIVRIRFEVGSTAQGVAPGWEVDDIAFNDAGITNQPFTLVTVDRGLCLYQPPTASAGSNQTVNEGTTVTLRGSAMVDPAGSGLPTTYAWTQTAGPAVTLTSASAPSPTFTAPSVATGTVGLAFSLRVKNGTLTSTPSVTNVTVRHVIRLPTVSVTGPAANSTASGTVNITANGSVDPDTSLTRIDFLVDNTVVGSKTSSPFSVAWDTTKAQNGAHTITAKIFDGASNVVTSSPLFVAVANTAEPLVETPPANKSSGCGCTALHGGNPALALGLLAAARFLTQSARRRRPRAPKNPQ